MHGAERMPPLDAAAMNEAQAEAAQALAAGPRGGLKCNQAGQRERSVGG
jgi:hypothetical protein